MRQHSPRAFPLGVPHLPWAPSTVRKAPPSAQRRGDLARGPACAKDADASTSRDAGTSATARTRNACGKSAAGRRLAARLNVARTPASKPSMPRPRRTRRQRAKVVPKAVENPKLRRAWSRSRKFFSSPLMRSARLPRTPRDLAPQPGSLSAAPPAVRRFATSGTGNVSGSLAAPWMAGRSGPSNTRPHAGTDPGVSRPPPPMCRRGHPRNDDASPMRRSSIIAWLREAVLAWASCCSPSGAQA